MTKVLGILGGGQLSWMLGEAARKIKVSTLAHGRSMDPVAFHGLPYFSGSLEAFFSKVQVMTIENEFVDTTTLKDGPPCSPSLECIRLFQDKLSQKKFLKENHIPTSEFLEFDPKKETLSKWIRRSRENWQDQTVFKWSRMGYDGKGVFITKSDSNDSDIEKFCELGLHHGPVYAEKKIEFSGECAIVAVRDHQGHMVFYPAVATQQVHGVCYLVWKGQEEWNFPLQKMARQVAEKTSYVGAFALELFHSKNNEFLVNEIAPRVHNTGHYSQDACQVSQFENHIRAVCGLGLSEPQPVASFAMINLLGPEGVEAQSNAKYPPAPEGLFVHDYGKFEIKPWRKLGHVNAVSNQEGEENILLTKLKAYQEDWSNGIRRAYGKKI